MKKKIEYSNQLNWTQKQKIRFYILNMNKKMLKSNIQKY